MGQPTRQDWPGKHRVIADLSRSVPFSASAAAPLSLATALQHNQMMARKIEIEKDEQLTDQEYADLANTVWMLMKLTGYDVIST